MAPGCGRGAGGLELDSRPLCLDSSRVIFVRLLGLPGCRRGVLRASFIDRVYSGEPIITRQRRDRAGVFTDHLTLQPHYQHYYFGTTMPRATIKAGLCIILFKSAAMAGLFTTSKDIARIGVGAPCWAAYQYRRDRSARPRTWAPREASTRARQSPSRTACWSLRPLLNWLREPTVPCASSRWPGKKGRNLPSAAPTFRNPANSGEHWKPRSWPENRMSASSRPR